MLNRLLKLLSPTTPTQGTSSNPEDQPLRETPPTQPIDSVEHSHPIQNGKSVSDILGSRSEEERNAPSKYPIPVYDTEPHWHPTDPYRRVGGPALPPVGKFPPRSPIIDPGIQIGGPVLPPKTPDHSKDWGFYRRVGGPALLPIGKYPPRQPWFSKIRDLFNKRKLK